MNQTAFEFLPLLRPGDEVLAVFLPAPSRRPVVRAVRISRVWISAAGTQRWEGVASNDLPGGGETRTHRVQGDRRQCIRLAGLESLAPSATERAA